MAPKTSLLNWFLLICLALLWGTSFMFISISVESVDPLSVVFSRLVVGAIILTAFVYAKGQRLPFKLRAWWAFSLMGVVGNVLPFALISWGQLAVHSSVAGMIMAIMPLITMLLAHYFVVGERLNRYKLIGFMLGITGITLLLGPVFQSGSRAVLGSLAILIAATSYAVNTILVKRLPKFSPSVSGAGVLIAASLILLPLWLFQSPINIDAFSSGSISATLWLGIGPTALATIILFFVIDRAGPTFLSTINFMVPVVAFFVGTLILSEPMSWTSIFALITILCGIGCTRLRTMGPEHSNP